MQSPSSYYELRDGTVWWVTPEKSLPIGPAVAFLYDQQDVALLRHGSPKRVAAYLRKIRDSYMQSVDPYIRRLGFDLQTVVIEVHGPADIERLNGILNTRVALRGLTQGTCYQEDVECLREMRDDGL